PRHSGVVQPPSEDLRMSSRIGVRRRRSVTVVHLDPAASPPGAVPKIGTIVGPKWIPWIFAAKTTASGLLALLVGFTFNLHQPKWALLTVFIVAQPQSGLVLAKSFYRIIGTLVGAAGALVLVALFPH